MHYVIALAKIIKGKRGHRGGIGLAKKTTTKIRQSRPLNLSRAERADLVKKRLFDAAVSIVGEGGYATATVSQITNRANVAQGTFYNYYSSRQDLMDQLLPNLGKEMIDFIKENVKGASRDPAVLEEKRFRAFFDFLIKRPHFMRILYEAALFAPKGYARHMQNVTKNYVRALGNGNSAGRFSPEELEVVAILLMGARSYLGYAFAFDGDRVHQPTDAVFTAYGKLMRHGLFGDSG